MYKIALIYFLFGINSFSQTLIGKSNGAILTLEDDQYELIFQTAEDKFVSFYMDSADGESDFFAFKNYLYLLFKNKKGDYLLQFTDNSLLLTYENEKVQLTLWRNHISDDKFCSR